MQLFKIAGFVLWPFGRTVVIDPRASKELSVVGNVFWMVLVGWWLALGHLIAGLFQFLTIIGIPLALASWKLVPLAFWPFGRRIVEVPTDAPLPPGSYIVTEVRASPPG